MWENNTVSTVVETEFEWLLYHLRSRGTSNGVKERYPAQTFQVADSIILRNGVPLSLYRSSSDGTIKILDDISINTRVDHLGTSNVVKNFSNIARA